VLIGAGFYVSKTQPISFLPVKGDSTLIVSAPFAVSLYWVMYAYSGWNASTYITSEIRDPRRNIPLSLGLGTIVVVVLYLGVNAVFLRTTPRRNDRETTGRVRRRVYYWRNRREIAAAFICIGLVAP
jgi:APA family basic amino acid/polyamine antiporter